MRARRVTQGIFTRSFPLVKIVAGTFLAIGAALEASTTIDLEETPPSNLWIEVDLLYWKPWEEALVATNEKTLLFATDDCTAAPVVHPHFDWNLGFRLKGGFHLPDYSWDVEANWTHFHSNVHQVKSNQGISAFGLFPIRSLSKDILAGDYVFRSELDWKLEFNWLDLTFIHSVSAPRRLDPRPFVGLRSAWVKQHGDLLYEGGIFLMGILLPGTSINGADCIKMKNNYWGIGPRAGIAPKLPLFCGLSLEGEAAISSLLGYFVLRQRETYLEVTRFSNHQRPFRVCFVGDFAAGAKWKLPLNLDWGQFVVGASWEYHLFLRQFALKRDRFGLVPDNRNLSVQGFVFSARLEF